MNKTSRIGAVGALLDIYENVILELKDVIEAIPDKVLPTIVDFKTADENCKSIQTILSHVVYAGYGYATSVHNHRGYNVVRPERLLHLTLEGYLADLSNLFTYTETIYKGINDSELEQFENSLKIMTSWGQVYDIEQLAEHAIVHVLRHTRQIKKFKNILLNLGSYPSERDG
jgi:hypothetical protein